MIKLPRPAAPEGSDGIPMEEANAEAVAVKSRSEGTQVQRTRRRWDGVALYGSFAVGAILTFCYSTDDPFITLRYAQNLVHRHGPVFNVGQRVEGFTSPLHLLLVTIAYLFPYGHGLLKVKLLSLLFAVLTLVAARRLFDALELPPLVRTIGMVLVGGSWSLAVASGNGLETTLTCWLTTLLVAGLVRGEASRRPVFIGLCGAGLAAVRPEGIVVALVLALVSLIAEPRKTAWWRRSAWFVGAVAADALIEAFRIAYYGQTLPNTYYAKAGVLSTDFRSGLNYLTRLLPGVPSVMKVLLLLLALIGAVTILIGSNRRSWYVVGAVVAQVGFILESGGDWMIGSRFFAPVVPMAAVLVTVGAFTVFNYIGRRFGSGLGVVKLAVSGLVGLVLIVQIVMPFIKLHDPVWTSRGRFDDASLVAAGGFPAFSNGVWPAGLALLSCMPSGSLVAYSEIGYAGFERPDLTFLDTRGLTDTAIAHDAASSIKGSRGVTDLDWTSEQSVVGGEIAARRPGAILSFDWRTSPSSTVLNGTYERKRVIHTLGWDGPFLVQENLALYLPSNGPRVGTPTACGRAR